MYGTPHYAISPASCFFNNHRLELPLRALLSDTHKPFSFILDTDNVSNQNKTSNVIAVLCKQPLSFKDAKRFLKGL
jgi:hypothetical protein